MTEEEKEHLVGLHVVKSAIKPLSLKEIRSQLSRLKQMPSCENDSDFWRIIQNGRERSTNKYLYTLVRKLQHKDNVKLIDIRLLGKKHYPE